MGITIAWDNDEKTIIRHIYDGTWTLEDYYALIDENYRLIDEVGHPVYIINDLRKMQGVPNDIVMAIRRAAHKAHPSEVLNVIVGASIYVSLLIDTIHKAVGTDAKLNHVTTLEEATKLIQDHMKQKG